MGVEIEVVHRIGVAKKYCKCCDRGKNAGVYRGSALSNMDSIAAKGTEEQLALAGDYIGCCGESECEEAGSIIDRLVGAGKKK